MNFSYLPPDLYTAFVAPGDVAWRDYFVRQQAFLQDIVKTPHGVVLTKGKIPIATDDGLLIDSEFTGAEIMSGGGGMVPYFIAATETFTVPLYRQALYEMTIDNEGILDVEGFLILVD